MNLTFEQKMFALFFAILPSSLKVRLLRSKGARIGRGVRLGLGTIILAKDFSKVRIGKFTTIRDNTIIACREIDIGKYVQIQTFVWIWGHGRLKLGDETQIGARAMMDLRNNDVTFGKHCGLGTGSVLYTHTHFKPHTKGWPNVHEDVVFEDGAMTGMKAIILPGVRVGEGSFVGAGAVVTRDIPPHSLATGSPAKRIKHVDTMREDVDENELRRRVLEIGLDMMDFFGHDVLQKRKVGGARVVRFRRPGRLMHKEWTLVIADAGGPKGSGPLDGLDGDSTLLLSWTKVPGDIRKKVPRWFDIGNHECCSLPDDISFEVWSFLYETWQEICDVEGPDE